MNTSMRLLKLIAPFKWWVALGILLSFLTIGSNVGLMAMSAYLISKAALVQDVTDIALAITAVRVFAIGRAAFRYFERYFTHTATFRILTHLRAWFFASIEPLAPARLMQYRSGDLLARIVADIETLENFYVRRYRRKISGPLLDRIDIHVEVPAVPYKDLSADYSGETSAEIRKRVVQTRTIQLERFKGDKIFSNGQMKTRHIKRYCKLDHEALTLIETAMHRLGLSARAYSRILKLARTILTWKV